MYIEGRVNSVKSQEVFSPYEVTIGRKKFFIHKESKECIRLFNDKDKEVGWFLYNLCFEDLMIDLFIIYDEMKDSQRTRRLLLRKEKGDNFNFLGLPQIYEWKKGKINETKYNIWDIFVDDDDYKYKK